MQSKCFLSRKLKTSFELFFFILLSTNLSISFHIIESDIKILHVLVSSIAQIEHYIPYEQTYWLMTKSYVMEVCISIFLFKNTFIWVFWVFYYTYVYCIVYSICTMYVHICSIFSSSSTLYYTYYIRRTKIKILLSSCCSKSGYIFSEWNMKKNNIKR